MKKRLKSVASLLLAMLMLMSAFQITASAAEPDSLIIEASEKAGIAGAAINVDISLKNNPGVSSLGVKVAYDKNILSLEKIVYNNEMGGTTKSSKLTDNPATLLWVNSSSDYAKDATLATLTFRVNASAKKGSVSEIKLSCNAEDIYNSKEKDLKFQTVNGKVTVDNLLSGDINNDGKVNNKDVSRLMQYLAHWSVEVNADLLDCNGDGKTNNKDVSRLMQYLAHWDVELHPIPKDYEKVLDEECKHKMERIDAVAPTCSKEGHKAYYACSICGKMFSDYLGTDELKDSDVVIAKLEHTVVVDPAIAPTKTSEGKTEGSHCSVCGDVITAQKTIPILGENCYTIKYNLYADDPYLQNVGIDNPNEAYYDSTKGLKLQNIKVEGYIFEGWYDAEGSSGEIVKNIPVGTTGEVELYAKWTPREYKITFNSPLVPVESKYYKVNTGATLTNPSLNGYNFIGWCDENNNLVTSIPVGKTGNITLYANWTSKRNQTRPVSHLDEPIILEDSDKGNIMFAYEIGTIENVPLQTLSDTYQSIGGMKQTYTTQESVNVTKGEAKTVAKTVSNSTTDSKAWSLSEDWNDVTSVSESYAKQKGWTKEEAEQRSKTSSNTYSMNSTSGGSQTNTTSNGLSGTLSKSNSSTAGGSLGLERETGSEYQVSDKYSLNSELNASLGVEKVASVGGKVSAGLETTESYKNYAKDKTSVNLNYSNTGTQSNSVTGQVNHSSSGTSTWNTSSGYSSSASTSQTESVRNVLSETINETKNYGSSYSRGGSKSDTQSFANTTAESDQYSSAITFSEGTTKTETKSIELGGENEGYYRFVLAGVAHVFAVVGFDVSTSSYYTFTYTVMDDKTYTFIDYSKDTASFNDNENGVLPFEVPYFVKEYVDARIMQTEGLSVSQDGIIKGYSGTDDIVFVPSYYRMDNRDGTYTSIKIKGITSDAFAGKNIRAISLSNFITEIPSGAFKDCVDLEAILCPGATKIQSYAFKGCKALREFSIPSSVETLGEHAFEGVEKLNVEAISKNVANGAINSGAKQLVLNISANSVAMKDAEFNVSKDVDSFELRGNANEFENIKLKSEAKTTVLNGLKIISTNGTPLQISSENITFNRLTVESSGFAALLTYPDTKLSLYGSVNMNSANGKAVVCRNLKVSEVDKAISSSFGINGNVLVCGKIEEQSLLTITNGSIITITDEEFEKYKNGAYEVTFDATGGTVKTVTQTVYYGSKYGTLPTPTKEYYVFDGWYTDAESGEKITEDSVFNQSKNIILYAHWTPNPASDWVLEKDLPASAKVEATKWTYDLVTRKKSNNSTMTGYIQYDSTWTWGEYGDWSGWQNSAVSGSDSRQVDTQWIAPTYKTQYYYSRWAQYSNNSGRFGPGQGTWSGVYCGYFFENGWRDDPLPYVSTRYSGQLGRDFTTWGDNGANAWYDQQTRQVQTGGGYTQYRYRDRSKIYTYYYMKTEAKESSTEVKESINTSAPSESITNVKKWVKYVNK